MPSARGALEETPRTQRGSPPPKAKRECRRGQRHRRPVTTSSAPTAPHTPQDRTITQKRSGRNRDRPACASAAAAARLGRLLARFQLLRAAFDLLAPRLLTSARRALLHRLLARDACHPPFRIPFAGKQRINKNPRHAADRDRDHDEDEGCVHGPFRLISPDQPKRHRAQPPAAAPRQSNAHAPRTSVDRCRSSDGVPIRLPLTSSPSMS